MLETNSWYSKHDYVLEFVDKTYEIHILLVYLGAISTSGSRVNDFERVIVCANG